jgi:phosphoserine phosphatase RsbX
VFKVISQNTFNKIDICAYQQAKKGRPCCGDSYYIFGNDDFFICAVADGLGSGSAALESSQAAIDVIKEYQEEDIHSLMNRCNKALRQKRGSVLAIFKIYFREEMLVYSCIGNIRFMLYSPSGKLTHPLPALGFLSGKPQTFKIQRFPYEPGSSFIIHSDGLEFRSIKSLIWRLSSPLDASNQLKQLIGIPKDDVTFLIGKIG